MRSSLSTVHSASLADDSRTTSKGRLWRYNALHLLLLESLTGNALALECLLESLPDDFLFFVEE